MKQKRDWQNIFSSIVKKVEIKEKETKQSSCLDSSRCETSNFRQWAKFLTIFVLLSLSSSLVIGILSRVLYNVNINMIFIVIWIAGGVLAVIIAGLVSMDVMKKFHKLNNPDEQERNITYFW